MASSPDVSVIISTFERCGLLRQALSSLAQQTLDSSQYEVVVCVDGSEDGTTEMLEEFAAPYSLRSVWQPNKGRAGACNTGTTLAGGELLIFLDDDMEPAPDFLTSHLEAHLEQTRVGVSGAVPMLIVEVAALAMSPVESDLSWASRGMRSR